jgi:hypothetical protein
MAVTRTHKGRKYHYYVCAYHYRRGKTICTNAISIPQAALDEVVLAELVKLLDEQVVALAVDKALAALREAQPQQEQRRAMLKKELSAISKRQENLTNAIARGDAPEVLLDALRKEDANKRHVEAELTKLDSLDAMVAFDSAHIVRSVKSRLADVTRLLRRQVPQARQALRKVLKDRIDCLPVEEHGRRGIRFTGQGHYERLLTGSTVSQFGMVAVDRNHGELTPHLFFEIKGFAAA